MKKGKIGVQMMMLREEIEKHGLYNIIEKLHNLGYHAIEVSQIFMTEENLSQLKKATADFGMDIIAMSCGIDHLSDTMKYPGDTLKHDFHKIVADCKAVNCNILRIGMMPLAFATSPEKMFELIELCEAYAKELKNHGIDLYYHAHTMEFYRLEGKPMLTHMFEKTTYLGFELDSHWMWRGGVNPVEYIKTFAGRIRAIHLKDYRIGLVKDETRISFGDIEEFAEVGEGTLDMPAIIQAGLESGSQYFIIEQDRFYDRTVYESLSVSRNNLIKMGYESWF